MHEQFRKVYAGLAAGAIVGWLGLGFLVSKTQPVQNSRWSLALFYMLVFWAVLCSVMIAQVYFRKRWFTTTYQYIIRSSFRQSLLASLLIISLLGLQAERLLFWWVAASLLLLFLCIEASFNL